MIEDIIAVAVPCYVANATPVVVARAIGKTHPIDFGRNFIDGRRILGNGKSIEGFISGLFFGTLTGIVLAWFGLTTPLRAFILSLGAMLGDMLGSFFKRRLGIRRGAPAPILDQLTFLVIALLLYQALFGDLALKVALVLILVTPLLHWGTNYIAFKLGLKDQPW